MKKGSGVLGMGFAALLAVALSTPSAHAQAAGKEVTVKTTDGAVFRGEVVESVPGQHVTLRLATGEFRKLPWNLIASQDGRSTSDSSGSSAASVGAGDVTVEVTADRDGAMLQRMPQGASGDAWEQVCVAPCTAHVDGQSAYRISGQGIVRSSAFRLPEGHSQVSVDATTGATSTTTWGAIMAIGGGGLALIGLPVLAFGALAESVDDTTEDSVDASGVVVVGAVMTLGGLALGVGGLVLLIGNSTTVDVSRQDRPLNVALPGGFELGPQGIAF